MLLALWCAVGTTVLFYTFAHYCGGTSHLPPFTDCPSTALLAELMFVTNSDLVFIAAGWKTSLGPQLPAPGLLSVERRCIQVTQEPSCSCAGTH